jgi:tetratricopeptide (TPR) repeat protein
VGGSAESSGDDRLPVRPGGSGVANAILHHWLGPVAVFLITFAVYFAATDYGFTNWDDPENFVENQGFRGSSRRALAWCFANYHLGHYHPLYWLSFAADFAANGLEPGPWHRTQIGLHAVAAVCVFAVARRFLLLMRPVDPPARRAAAAAIAALLFSLHPLRVETAAWLSARHDALASIFSLLCLLAYLNYAEWPTRAPRRGAWMFAACLLFTCAALSKDMSLTLPVVLLVIDAYPLRRWAPSFRSMFAKSTIQVWSEKAAMFAIALVLGVNAVIASSSALWSLEDAPWSLRFTHALVGLMFYPFKSLFPFQLSPFYEQPGTFGLAHPFTQYALAGLIAGFTILLALRRRLPGLIAVCICYVILVLPVSGILQRGTQFAADRYSYMSCIPFAIAAAFGVCAMLAHWKWPTLVIGGAVVLALSALSRRQLTIWSDSISLWQRAIAVDRHNGTGHANLAHAYETRGLVDDAIREYEIALRIRPTQPDVHRNLAAIFARRQRHPEAIAHYLADVEQNPRRVESRYYLGVAYERIGDLQSARTQFQQCIHIAPEFVLAHVALARLTLSGGDVDGGEALLRKALALDSSNASAMELLAQVCARTGRISEAIAWYDRAIEIAEERGQRDGAAAVRTIRNQRAAEATTRAAPP